MSPTPNGHGLGYRKSAKRPATAFPMHAALTAQTTTIPFVDLRHLCSPIKDQLQYSTCTANATAGMFEYELRRQRVSVPHAKSRAFNYWYAGVLEGNGEQFRDDGRDPYYNFLAIERYGLPDEDANDPYNGTSIISQPSDQAIAAAKHRLATKWAQVPVGIDALKAALAAQYCVGFGFTVYESFEGQQAATTGVVPMPQPGERVLGGHMIYACGYSDLDLAGVPASHVICANSWGAGFGAHGYVYMPYELFVPQYVGELLVLEVVSRF